MSAISQEISYKLLNKSGIKRELCFICMCVEMSLLIYTPFNVYQEKEMKNGKNAQQKGSREQWIPNPSIILHYITTYGKGSGNTSFKFVL